MIFVGDVAIAENGRFEHVGVPQRIAQLPWCVNLEGAIACDGDIPKWGVYNSPSWLESFDGLVLGPVFMANNHILDVPNGIKVTKRYLRHHGLACFGAGDNSEEAGNEVVQRSESYDYVLIGFGWSVIGCLSATKTRPGVNGLEDFDIRKLASSAVERHLGKRVVCVLHWNYEFERYPQPGHRKLAQDLIDDGIHAVIGHHPHVVSPVERYRGRVIAYSLGNWAFSYGRHLGGRLRFPKSSFPQIALELGPRSDIVHHARFVPPSEVVYERAEHVSQGDFSLKPAFEGASHAEYARWFKANRVKKRCLPIYYSYSSSWENCAKDRFVALRQLLIDSAVKVGLKSVRRTS